MKHIMQHDTMQCGVACIEMICKYYDVLETGRKAGGVACIEMICKYYRKKYYFNSLSYLYTTTEGISLFALSLLAKEIGLRTICGRINMKKLKKQNLLASSIGIKIILLYYTKSKRIDSTLQTPQRDL